MKTNLKKLLATTAAIVTITAVPAMAEKIIWTGSVDHYSQNYEQDDGVPTYQGARVYDAQGAHVGYVRDIIKRGPENVTILTSRSQNKDELYAVTDGNISYRSDSRMRINVSRDQLYHDASFEVIE